MLIAWRNPGVCYAAVSLMFFWPVADTFLAIWRRSLRNKKMMHADYLHAHQFIMRAMQIRWKMPLARANSATTVVLAPFFLAPIFSAVFLIDRPVLALGAWIAYGALFCGFLFDQDQTGPPPGLARSVANTRSTSTIEKPR